MQTAMAIFLQASADQLVHHVGQLGREIRPDGVRDQRCGQDVGDVAAGAGGHGIAEGEVSTGCRRGQ